MHLYKPSAKKVEVVDAPQMNMLMIGGEDNPNYWSGISGCGRSIILPFLCKTMQEKRENYVAGNPQLTSEQKQAILNGEIIQGMTMDMVIASWGKPKNIIKEVIKSKNITRWIYAKEITENINKYEVRFVAGIVRAVKFKGTRHISRRAP